MAFQINESTVCQECIDTIFYWPFQMMIGFHVFFSIASICSVTHFLVIHIRPSPLHVNFKTLLTIYFLNSILHSCIFLVSSGSLFNRIFHFERPQDAHMDPITYKIIHLVFCYSLLIQVLSEFLICVERVIATVRVCRYEHERMGGSRWIYVGIIFLIPVAMVQWAYYDEKFEKPRMFPLLAPEDAQQNVNILFLIGMILVTSALLITFYIRQVNKRKVNIYQFRLTTRYQIAENIVTSHIMSTVLLSNLIVTCIFTICIMILRNLDNDYQNQHMPLFSTIRLLIYPHHVAALVIPLFSGCYLAKIRRTRIANMSRMVLNQKNGLVVSEAYRSYLTRQWKSF